MLARMLLAWCLIAATVVIHAVGVVMLLVPVLHSRLQREGGFWSVTWLVIQTAWGLILLHVVEIAVWALFYWWQRCLPDMEAAFYFAGVTYTTVGYGDLVLPKAWRLFGPLEGLTGILMCGLSTGFFFAMVSRVYAARLVTRSESRTPISTQPDC